MTQSIPLETYKILEKEFGQTIAERVTSLFEFSFSQAEKKVEQIATQKKLEIRDELSKELASKGDISVVKADIAVIRSEIDVVKAEFKTEIKSIRFEMKLYFVVLLSAMIILNKDSLTLIGQLLGVIK